MVKPLAFKGDKKSKKRKHTRTQNDDEDASSQALTTTQPNATSTSIDEDDSWVTAEAPTDVTGPIIFALPTTPPTCIACDANGKVFASALENIVEGDPATAEPHDVRQVWVANRVAGTESMSFKGHHGRLDLPHRSLLINSYVSSLNAAHIRGNVDISAATNSASSPPRAKPSRPKSPSSASPPPTRPAPSPSRRSARSS